MARTKKADTETTVQETVSEETTEVSAVENSNKVAESQGKPEQKDGQKIYIGISTGNEIGNGIHRENSESDRCRFCA